MDFLGRWQEAKAKQVRKRCHGKREASGILKIEMSLGEEKSIQAMNLLVWADSKKHHNEAVDFFLKKSFKNNYPCTLAGVSLKKNITYISTIFQKDFKILKLPPTVNRCLTTP